MPGTAQASMVGADPRSKWCDRVRAVSPTPVRQGETPPEGWHAEFALGSVKLSNAHHRILPDFFIQGGVAWPGA